VTVRVQGGHYVLGMSRMTQGSVIVDAIIAVARARFSSRRTRFSMNIRLQLIWLVVLAAPVASIAWTMTHEDLSLELPARR
jgi:hypothetical protein